LKPPGNPPAWVFGPVWTVLYLAMGASAGILANHRAIPALSFFLFQLTLNLLWTPVFFGAHRVDYALGIIVLLWAVILVTLHLARSVRPLAAWLLVPYLAWVSYATYLNAGIFVLNK
jgi:tryptophan-rich sensory protein